MEHTKREGRIDSMKKMISILLSVALFLSVFPASVFAAGSTNEYTESGYTYTIENDEATITGYDDSITGDVVLPDTLGGYPVRHIGDYAFISCKMTAIDIPDGVTSIGWNAFARCTELVNIKIPDSVTSIDVDAFNYCTSLMSIKIPEGVTEIPLRAFYECIELSSVELPESVTKIDNEAFYYCTSLTSLKIPEGVTSIGNFAFGRCNSLVDIEIPNSMERFCSDAFYLCENIQNVYISDVASWCDIDFSSNPLCYNGNLYLNGELLCNLTIPEGVVDIAAGAFYGCNSITSVEIPKSVKNIGYAAFKDCKNLKDVYISDISDWCKINFQTPESNPLSNYGNLWVDGELLCDLNVPSNVSIIKNYAFTNYKNLTSVKLPESIAYIGESAFADCINLKNVEIPGSVQEIQSKAFSGCENLQYLEIAAGVKNIGDYAFYGDNSLTTIKIPDSVTSIGIFAFANCRSLVTMEIPASVETIDYGNFVNCNEQLLILCYNNSAAHKYAKAYNIACEFIQFYLQPNAVTLNTGDTKQLTAVIEDPTVNIIWNSSNPEIVSVSSSGYITANAEGKAIITASTGDYTATCNVNVKSKDISAIYNYTITYISAATNAALPEAQIKKPGHDIQLSTQKPSRAGYRFEGWSTEPNDTTVEYQPGDTYTEDADLTLYAVWKWTPKCSACDGTGQKRVSCQECDGDGYTTVKTSRTCTRCSGKGTVKQTYTVKEEHTCPICHGELVTWSDSLQGWVPCRGCNGLGTVTVEVEKEKNVTCSTCNGLGKIYSTSTKTCSTCLGVGYKKVRCTQCGGDGICTQDSFGVSYDPNGGTGAPASQTKEKASSLTLSNDIPVKDGYIFCGWSTSVGGSVKYQPGDIYSADQDLILVAVWQKEPEPIPGYSCGDIDNNGTINLKDVTQLQKYLAGWDVEVATEYCDVNADGEINLKDVTHLQKYLAGWEVKLGQS